MAKLTSTQIFGTLDVKNKAKLFNDLIVNGNVQLTSVQLDEESGAEYLVVIDGDGNLYKIAKSDLTIDITDYIDDEGEHLNKLWSSSKIVEYIEQNAGTAGIIPVSLGGTGLSSIGTDEFIVGDNQSNFITKSKADVWKLIINNTVSGFETILPITKGGTGTGSFPNNQYVLGASSGTGLTTKTKKDVWDDIVNQESSTKLNISNGGTGTGSFPKDSYIIGDTTNGFITKTPAQVWDDISSVVSGFSSILPINKGGTGKSSISKDNYLVGGSSDNSITQKTKAQVWNEITNAGTSSVAVTKGGTGLTTIPANNYLYASAKDTIVARTTASVWNDIANAGSASVDILHGGTGKTSFNENQIHYGSFSQSNNFTYDGDLNLANGDINLPSDNGVVASSYQIVWNELSDSLDFNIKV